MHSLKTEVSYSQHVLENLMHYMHEGLLVLDTNDVIETVNDAALRLLGYTRKEKLLGRHVHDIYAYPENFESVAILSKADNAENWENTFLRSDGSTFSGAYSIRIIEDVREHSVMKMILLRDITAEKKYAETIVEHTRNLERSNKELDQFAYIVSHDLKAPLRAISNLSSWLEEDLGPSLSDESKGNLNMLRGRVARLEALINGILEYSRVDRGEVQLEDVNISLLIEEVIELLAPASNVMIEVDSLLPVIHASRVMVHQVFSNLLSNAIKYNDKEEVRIKISAIERDNFFEFIVSDNGPGIAKEYHDKIFMIFQTLQPRDKFESTGIGLTIVRKILKTRGGRIWVESEPGQGSKFIFNWPKQAPQNNG